MGFTDVGKAVRSARVLLKPEPFSVFDREGFEYSRAYNQGVKDAILHFMQRPTADVVSRDVLEQVMWERDLAISQLAEIGKGLGEKMDEVD